MGLVVLVGAVIAGFYLLNAAEKPFQAKQEKTRSSQTKESRTSTKPSEKPTKKGKETSQLDPVDLMTSITNKFDKTISKELNKAQSVLDKGQVDDALKKFETLVNKYPMSPRAQYGKALSLDQLAERRQSNSILQQSIDAYDRIPDLPDCPLELKRRAMRRQADRLSFLGKMGQAAHVLKKLLSLFPRDTKLMNELGVQYLLSGKNRDAEKLYQQVCYV